MHLWLLDLIMKPCWSPLDDASTPLRAACFDWLTVVRSPLYQRWELQHCHAVNSGICLTPVWGDRLARWLSHQAVEPPHPSDQLCAATFRSVSEASIHVSCMSQSPGVRVSRGTTNKCSHVPLSVTFVNNPRFSVCLEVIGHVTYFIF